MTDVLVIGAGPAGMSAALDLQQRGLAVTVVDDLPSPGGRIFAAIESREAHGGEERTGADLAARFRKDGGTYLPATEVWQIEVGPRVFVTQSGKARILKPRFVLMATGAQERPMPFPGWQLPGVMTIGGAQILLKTARQIPADPVWLAGSGPLLLLYAHQLISAGGAIAGVLDTTPTGSVAAAAKFLPGAVPYGWRDLARGLAWWVGLASTRTIRGVTALEAVGSDRLESIRYTTRSGDTGEVPAKLLLVHDGVVPSLHSTMAAGCAHQWNDAQRCLEPIVDRFGRSSVPEIFVAGDGATIAGARAAIVSGKLAAIGIAHADGKVSAQDAEVAVAPLRRKLASAARFRRFVDQAYPPVEMAIPDATMLCRCEEATAGQIRSALTGRPHLGADGVKLATRAGMGPCQGRQCGASLNRLIAEVHGVGREEAGFLRIRAPLKPLTLGELASLDEAS